jgi:hypothetical protein
VRCTFAGALAGVRRWSVDTVKWIGVIPTRLWGARATPVRQRGSTAAQQYGEKKPWTVGAAASAAAGHAASVGPSGGRAVPPLGTRIHTVRASLGGQSRGWSDEARDDADRTGASISRSPGGSMAPRSESRRQGRLRGRLHTERAATPPRPRPARDAPATRGKARAEFDGRAALRRRRSPTAAAVEGTSATGGRARAGGSRGSPFVGSAPHERRRRRTRRPLVPSPRRGCAAEAQPPGPAAPGARRVRAESDETVRRGETRLLPGAGATNPGETSGPWVREHRNPCPRRHVRRVQAAMARSTSGPGRVRWWWSAAWGGAHWMRVDGGQMKAVPSQRGPRWPSAPTRGRPSPANAARTSTSGPGPVRW